VSFQLHPDARDEFREAVLFFIRRVYGLEMATIKDVAELAGVSFKTVSRVINRSPYVKDEVRPEVLRAARWGDSYVIQSDCVP